jgi:2-oxoglutarate dehydrogenase E2 component (dihydrolipoamide succinyltransferase)
MSTFDIKMPKLGESITEGTIVQWSVKVGDVVQEDAILFEVTTAKVNAEVPCPIDGKVVELLYNEGDTIEVGTVVARILPEGSEESETGSDKADIQAPSAETKSDSNSISAEAKPAEPMQQASTKPSRWYSPVVLKIAKEHQLREDELDVIPGTGYLQRLSKNDLVQYLETKRTGIPRNTERNKATPEFFGSAEKKEPVETKKPLVSHAPASDALPAFQTQSRPDAEIVQMDPVARIIAERMVESKKTSAHVTTVVEVDVTKLVQFRSKVKESFFKQEGLPLNYLPFIVESTVQALKEFPKLNASVADHTFVLKKHIHMGIAVALDNGNLVVPVIHHADKLNVSGLAHAIDEVANKARNNKLKLEDIEGGTFTITNFGTFKNLIGTPIINQPEVAILGVGYVEKKPAVVETPEGDVIAIRHKMYLSLTYDHRIINGAVGGAFLKRIADLLENRQSF